MLEPAGADALHEHLAASPDWQLVVNHGDQIIELDSATRHSLTADQWRKLELGVANAARQGFQFRFENIRVPDDEPARSETPTLLNRFASFLSSPAVVEWLRQVTGAESIDFADAQATAYGAGDFLTPHDDAIEGKRRLAAYVFNLTPHWRADWGGLLLFHGPDGHIERAYVPTYNALNIFAVPAVHSVSQVASYAPARRYSVTGWLRARG